MRFKLPSLHLGLIADKKVPDEDPRKNIHVIGGSAILQNGIIAVVNLREYIKTECSISETEDINELNSILTWMEGKSFSKEFWMELTSECFVTLNVEGLTVTHNTYKVNLIYDFIDCDLKSMLKVIKDNIGIQPLPLETIAMDGQYFSTLMAMFGKELKADTFVFQICGLDRPVRFTALGKEYIYGLVPTNYSAATDVFLFSNVNDFKAKITEYLA